MNTTSFFEVLLTLKKQNLKLTYKTRALMKNQEETVQIGLRFQVEFHVYDYFSEG